MSNDALRARLRRNSQRDASGCWVWTKYRMADGYGVVKVAGSALLAHRVSYAAFVGQIPDGMSVLHQCDNPPCINPAHLSIGTHADNMRDRNTKGRARGKSWKGEAHPSVRLTGAAIAQIRSLAGSAPQSVIAKQFGVSQGHISNIINGKTWNHKGEQQ